MLVLQISESCVCIQADESQFTLSANDYVYSRVSKLPSHRHQGVDEGGPFGEVLLKGRARQH